MKKEWDVFISHASEDKAALVKPLANALKEAGVKVWFDEFELKFGDSLSRSIDYGLVHASFGIVILSKSFFAKQWTDYELRSLLSRVTGGEHIILPIWHNIDRKDIMEYSPYLADIKALSTSIGIEDLALEITKKVRPDILNSYLRMHMCKQMKKEPGIKVEIPLKNLHDSPVRHEALPSYLVISCRLIEEVFADILGTSYVEMVENFAKDWDYQDEFIVWSAMANAYVGFIRETHCDPEDLAKKKEAFSVLLLYSANGGEFTADLERYPLLSAYEQEYLVRLYLLNLKHIRDMVDRFDGPNTQTHYDAG